MNPLQPVISATQQIGRRIRQGVPIPWFTGKTLFSKSKHNEVLAAVNALINPKLNPPTAGKITISDVDIMFDLSGLTGATPTPPSSGLTITRYALVSCPGTIDGAGHVTNGDYIVCRPLGGLGDGSQDVTVAKPYKWRLSLTGVTEMGITYAFTYQTTTDGNNPQRTKTAGPTSEIEMLIPVWTPMQGTDTATGDEILAIGDFDTGVNDSNGVRIQKEYLCGSPRQWAKVGTGS